MSELGCQACVYDHERGVSESTGHMIGGDRKYFGKFGIRRASMRESAQNHSVEPLFSSNPRIAGLDRIGDGQGAREEFGEQEADKMKYRKENK